MWVPRPREGEWVEWWPLPKVCPCPNPGACKGDLTKESLHEYLRILRRDHFADKDPYSQSYGFSSSHVWMWQLDHKEDWGPKNWCFQTVVLEKTLESPLDCTEIKPVNPKGNQPFIGRTDVGAPILWPPDAKIWLTEKDPDAGKDWGQKEKEVAEDEMGGWYHRLSGYEFEQTLGECEGQGSLVCCSSWSDWTTTATKMRSSWISWVGPKPDDKCPQKRQKKGRQKCGGKKWPGRERLAKIQSRKAKNHHQLEAAKEQALPRACRKQGVALPTPWFWASGVQSGERLNISCFKPPSLWYFVIAAVGNQSR